MILLLPSLGLEIEQRLPTLRLEVLDIMRLVENKVLPLLSPKRGMILNNEFITSDAHMKGIGLAPSLSLESTLTLRAVVGENLESGRPLLELELPVEHHGRWDNDKVWAPDRLGLG